MILFVQFYAHHSLHLKYPLTPLSMLNSQPAPWRQYKAQFRAHLPLPQNELISYISHSALHFSY